MTDPAALGTLIEQEQPDLVIPDIEAIATTALAAVGAAGTTVVPAAGGAARVTMDRDGHRGLVAEELGLPPYAFADTIDEVHAAVDKVGVPCSSPRCVLGQGTVDDPAAAADARRGPGTSRSGSPMPAAGAGCSALSCGDEVLFSEVSSHPHDTGMVTMASRRLSEFELHARAVLGPPLDTALLRSPGTSAVIYGGVEAKALVLDGVDEALAVPASDVRLFGKPHRHPTPVGWASRSPRPGTSTPPRERATRAASLVRPVPTDSSPTTPRDEFGAAGARGAGA